MRSKTSSVILVYQRKILLILRDNDPRIPNPNCWQLIGGLVEKKETHREAIIREMKEEINIVPGKLEFLGKRQKPNQQIGAYYCSRLSAKDLSNLLKGQEGQKIEFFDFSSLANLPLSGTIKYLVLNRPKELKKLLEENERVKGVEPSVFSLGRRHLTAKLHPH